MGLKKGELRTLLYAMFVPFFVYASISTMMSFEWHRRLEFLMWLCIFCIGLGLAIYYGSCVMQLRYGVLRNQRWHLIFVIMLTLTFVSGITGGDRTYWQFMYPYYVTKDLASYINVNPKLERGQSYMDAGVIYFREGTRVSTED